MIDAKPVVQLAVSRDPRPDQPLRDLGSERRVGDGVSPGLAGGIGSARRGAESIVAKKQRIEAPGVRERRTDLKVSPKLEAEGARAVAERLALRGDQVLRQGIPVDALPKDALQDPPSFAGGLVGSFVEDSAVVARPRARVGVAVDLGQDRVQRVALQPRPVIFAKRLELGDDVAPAVDPIEDPSDAIPGAFRVGGRARPGRRPFPRAAVEPTGLLETAQAQQKLTSRKPGRVVGRRIAGADPPLRSQQHARIAVASQVPQQRVGGTRMRGSDADVFPFGVREAGGRNRDEDVVLFQDLERAADVGVGLHAGTMAHLGEGRKRCRRSGRAPSPPTTARGAIRRRPAPSARARGGRSYHETPNSGPPGAEATRRGFERSSPDSVAPTRKTTGSRGHAR